MPRAKRTCRSCPALVTTGGQCDSCRKSDRKLHDQARGSSTERGYTSRGHKRFRRQVLDRDPICVLCGKAWSTVADHYPLSRKQLADSGADPNDLEHGRGLCKPCHDRETARNQPGGWAWAPKRLNDLVTVVAGPPCGGKNVYIAQHARPGETVVDYDAIMAILSGRPLHDHDPSLTKRALTLRDHQIAELLASGNRGWIISSSPTARRRHAYGAPVVLLMPGRDTALTRARSERPALWEQYIRDWYDTYEPDPRDLVISAAA